MKADWLAQIDMRAFFAAHPDFSNMFKSCVITDTDGNLDNQCFNMSTLAYAQTS